jgi:hypothetical protein
MLDFLDIARTAASLDWTWTRSWWEEAAAKLGFHAEALTATLGVYRDQDGNAWRARFDGASLLFCEVVFDVSGDLEDLSLAEYDDVIDEYYEKFQSAVVDLMPVLGKPTFCDGAAAKGFPDDQDAVWLALWRIEHARLMLEQKHESQEFPIRHVFIFAPEMD